MLEDTQAVISEDFLANISAFLSRLLAKYEASQNRKILAMIKKISPAAWRHINLNGHYTFRNSGQTLNLDSIVAALILE